MSYDFGGTYFEDAQLVSTYKKPSLDLLERIHVTQDEFRSETDCDYSIEVSSINKSNCKITKLKAEKYLSEFILGIDFSDKFYDHFHSTGYRKSYYLKLGIASWAKLKPVYVALSKDKISYNKSCHTRKKGEKLSTFAPYGVDYYQYNSLKTRNFKTLTEAKSFAKGMMFKNNNTDIHNAVIYKRFVTSDRYSEYLSYKLKVGAFTYEYKGEQKTQPTTASKTFKFMPTYYYLTKISYGVGGYLYK